MLVMPYAWSDDLEKCIRGTPDGYYTLEFPLGETRMQPIVNAINQGIDGHLEVVFFKQETVCGKIKLDIENRSLHVLVRRLMEFDDASAAVSAANICGRLGIALTRFWRLDPFLKGYVTCAFFTWDEDAPGGMDYGDSGRAEELLPQLDAGALQRMVEDCEKFKSENKELLKKAGSEEQNGHDFWYNRNHHGVGFWDRGYATAVGDALSRACKGFGECNLSRGDDGKIYLE